MSEPVTREEFRTEMRDFRKDLLDSHLDLRTHLLSAVMQMGDKLEAHRAEDSAISDRVLVIETERKIEQGQALRKNALVATLITGTFTALVELIKRWAH